MADDAQVEDGSEAKPSLIGKLVPIAITVLVPIILALVVLKLFLLPMLVDNMDGGESTLVPIDPMERTMRLAMPFASVITNPDDTSRPLLQYTPILVCSSPETVELLTAEEDRVMGIVSALHRNRTMTLLDSPAFQDSLAAQTQDELNTLLRRLRPEEEHQVRDVTYLEFNVIGVN